MDNGGIKSHSVNDKAVISHGIAQKTELSKKSGGEIEKRQVRTIGGSDKDGKPADTQGVPSVAAQKREHFTGGSPKKSTTNSAAVSDLVPQAAETITSGKLAKQNPMVSAISKAVEPPKSGVTERKTLTLNAEKTAKIGKPKPSPTAAARWKKRFKDKRPKLAPRKNYKVLENGVVSSEKLTKRKERVIYRQKPQKLKKLKLKRLQKQKFKIDKKQADLMQMAMGGGSIGSSGRLKKLVPMGVSGAKKVYRFAQKPAEMLKQEFYSKSDKNETGTSAAKLGMQTYDYVGRGAKTAVETGVKTVKKGAKITKRVYRKLHKPTSVELKRALKKEVMETQAKKALKDKVTSFCDSDDNDPRKIIQYIDKDNNILCYPAKGADSTINSIIDNFGTEDYADYMSLLFVLMTREKQQADGVTDAEIYDFDFKKEDFEEFMKTVNENSCRWGDTFVIKTAEETGGNTCPNEQCRRETEPGCQTRMIDSKIVSELAHQHLLYQDKRGNAVFLHKDENGETVGAELQGTSTYQRFKGVARGMADSVFTLQIGHALPKTRSGVCAV